MWGHSSGLGPRGTKVSKTQVAPWRRWESRGWGGARHREVKGSVRSSIERLRMPGGGDANKAWGELGTRLALRPHGPLNSDFIVTSLCLLKACTLHTAVVHQNTKIQREERQGSRFFGLHAQLDNPGSQMDFFGLHSLIRSLWYPYFWCIWETQIICYPKKFQETEHPHHNGGRLGREAVSLMGVPV